MTSTPLTPEVLEQHEVAVLLTDHDAFDYAMIAAHAPLVVDTRNAMARVEHDPDRVVLLGGGHRHGRPRATGSGRSGSE